MAITLKTMMDRLPDDERKQVNARAKELISEELTLRDIRKARDLTQKHMAEKLNIGQDSISRLEKRSDLLLSTLRNHISAMGGSLELIVHFPDRHAVILPGLIEWNAAANRISDSKLKDDVYVGKRPGSRKVMGKSARRRSVASKG